MEASIGVNLRVTAHSSQGGRKYMEDMFCVAYQPTADERDLLYAYFGIFDGHGGREAALYAKQHLMDNIVQQKNFWSDDDSLVLKSIKDGFISTHYAMWKDLENWPRTSSGLPSTSGTTASVGFVRKGKLYIGHVGDSAIILGYQDPTDGYWRAKSLTKDHKPECAMENTRITQCGGKVISKCGVPRVVWNRPRVGHKGPVRRSTLIDEIPFLAVARSLGDLWSYNSTENAFVVSPEPDCSVVEIDVSTHRCFVFGSDGLWNMLTAQDAVNSVYFAEKNNERQLLASPPDTASTQVKNWINPSKRLVDRALDRWYNHNLRADNTSVVTVVIDPPGPPKAQVLRQSQRRSYVIRHSGSFSTDPGTSNNAVSKYNLGTSQYPKPGPQQKKAPWLWRNPEWDKPAVSPSTPTRKSIGPNAGSTKTKSNAAATKVPPITRTSSTLGITGNVQGNARRIGEGKIVDTKKRANCEKTNNLQSDEISSSHVISSMDVKAEPKRKVAKLDIASEAFVKTQNRPKTRSSCMDTESDKTLVAKPPMRKRRTRKVDIILEHKDKLKSKLSFPKFKKSSKNRSLALGISSLKEKSFSKSSHRTEVQSHNRKEKLLIKKRSTELQVVPFPTDTNRSLRSSTRESVRITRSMFRE